MTIWLPTMFKDETDMLQMRLEELEGHDAITVLAESPVTHRSVPKPLHFTLNEERYARWADRIIRVAAGLPGGASPWEREHAQRHAAWPVIDAAAGDGDVVIIADADEIPSSSLLEWDGPDVVAARMRTTLFAVDWEVPQHLIPPTCVAARVSYLRKMAGEGKGLGDVRDGRRAYPVLGRGGWHFSWTGGPAAQKEKLLTSTCHTELIGTREGDLIASGERYRTDEDGGGLPVIGVDVDETWPAFIREKRCPPEWFRPRESA